MEDWLLCLRWILYQDWLRSSVSTWSLRVCEYILKNIPNCIYNYLQGHTYKKYACFWVGGLNWGAGSWKVHTDGGFNTFKSVTQNYRLLCDVFAIFWYFWWRLVRWGLNSIRCDLRQSDESEWIPVGLGVRIYTCVCVCTYRDIDTYGRALPSNLTRPMWATCAVLF